MFVLKNVLRVNSSYTSVFGSKLARTELAILPHAVALALEGLCLRGFGASLLALPSATQLSGGIRQLQSLNPIGLWDTRGRISPRNAQTKPIVLALSCVAAKVRPQ